MVVAFIITACALLLGSGALGAVVYGVSAHLEADDLEASLPRARW
ncbi:MAG TPA: hypothetical protein VFE13_13685 [Caulobacteraceae bacterium]|jgi:hypothetical protein|nr:hypothetical protein [Caulobacteraceae bacterium]